MKRANVKADSVNMWVVVKFWALFESLLKYGTYYLGYPKKDHNFDNRPCLQKNGTSTEPSLSAACAVSPADFLHLALQVLRCCTGASSPETPGPLHGRVSRRCCKEEAPSFRQQNKPTYVPSCLMNLEAGSVQGPHQKFPTRNCSSEMGMVGRRAVERCKMSTSFPEF